MDGRTSQSKKHKRFIFIFLLTSTFPFVSRRPKSAVGSPIRRGKKKAIGWRKRKNKEESNGRDEGLYAERDWKRRKMINGKVLSFPTADIYIFNRLRHLAKGRRSCKIGRA